MNSFTIFIHIIAGTILVSLSAIMQLIVGPAVSEITDAKTKTAVNDKLKKIRIPIMDSAIVIQIITAIYLLYARWNMIETETVMQIKAVTGIAALSLASLAHFYLRGKKIRLEKANMMEELGVLNKKSRVVERFVLGFAAITYLLGVYYNHM
jgi:hypothetical protein